MTKEQEELLKLQVRTGNYFDKTGFFGKIPNHDGDVRFLCDGEVIEFTKFDYTARNVECEINGDPHRKLWYSQLSAIYYSSEMMEGYSMITLKGKEYVFIRNLAPCEFCEYVKGKKFRVEVDKVAIFGVNRNSNMYKDFSSYDDVRNYVMKCIEDNRITDIGDILKFASCYDLYEI